MGVKEEDEEPIKRAMEAMGWDTSSGLPMANEENRQLLDEWQRLFAQKIELIEIDKQNVERVNKIQQHTKNAENTINHNLVSGSCTPLASSILSHFNPFSSISLVRFRNYWMPISRKCVPRVIS